MGILVSALGGLSAASWCRSPGLRGGILSCCDPDLKTSKISIDIPFFRQSCWCLQESSSCCSSLLGSLKHQQAASVAYMTLSTGMDPGNLILLSKDFQTDVDFVVPFFVSDAKHLITKGWYGFRGSSPMVHPTLTGSTGTTCAGPNGKLDWFSQIPPSKKPGISQVTWIMDIMDMNGYDTPAYVENTAQFL